MSDMTVAKTILAQLGGARFRAMTGAKDFIGGDNYLAFALPRGLVPGVNKVKITLTPMDLYDVEFGSIRRHSYTVNRKREAVYCDNLRSVFETETGLRTSL